jgi:hypothetical protein
MPRRMVHTRLGSVTLSVTVASLCAHALRAQAAEATQWRVAGVLSQAFGGEGRGGMVGATYGLFSGSSLLGGLGVDLSWSKPEISGLRTSGVPPRRAFASLDVHLRTRVMPGPIAIELGLPLGIVRSDVGEAAVTELVDPGPPRSKEPGARYGPTAGVLGAVRVAVGSRLSLCAESKVLSAWIFGQQHWLAVHSVGFQARLR